MKRVANIGANVIIVEISKESNYSGKFALLFILMILGNSVELGVVVH